MLSNRICIQRVLDIGRISILQGCVQFRAKYTRSKYDVNKIVRLGKENKLLFGPVLKEKDLKPKKKKSKKKKPVIEGISTIVEEAKAKSNETEVLDVSVDHRVHITCKDETTSHENYIPPENFITLHERVSNAERSVKAKAKKDKVDKPEKPPPLPVFDFMLNFPLDVDPNSDVENCGDFRAQVEEFSLRSLPTVSMILNRTQSDTARFFLQRWREKSIAEMGKEVFYEKMEEVKRDGINLHACIQQFLSGKEEDEIQIQPRTQGYWESLQPAFAKLGDVKAVETKVKHPFLQYQGTYDCMAIYRDTLCVIDWKTSQKPKPLLSNTFDNPLQVAAYVGAVNASAESLQLQPGPVTSAAIVIAYPWGEPAHVHVMKTSQCEEYWNLWLARLNLFWNTIAREKGVR